MTAPDYEPLSSTKAELFNSLRARLSVGRASEHEAIAAIKELCEDNERLAVLIKSRTSLAQAAVAAAYEAAASVRVIYVEEGGHSFMTPLQPQTQAAIRALATPDQIAALTAKVDASQAPNPAVNGGRCQSDTIPLSRAEVEALMEAADKIANWTIGGMLADDPENRSKYPLLSDSIISLRKALATLQERMK